MRKKSVFKYFVALSLMFSLIGPAVSDAFAKKNPRATLLPDPKKYAALVIDADTGVVLHEKNADKKRYPASLVKMMTLYLTFDAMKNGKLDLNEYLKVSRRAAAQPSMNINLENGDKIKVRDAIYALIVRSANDAAVVLAEGISGTEDQFSRLMNVTAKRLGMRDTNFVNASGLHNPKQVTTAKDMARILIALQRDFPKYYRYMTRTNFMRKGHQYKSHNKVLATYNGATGGKTGFVNASGFNLATSAQRRNHNIVAVVMGGKTSNSRDRIMVSLLDKGFEKLGAVEPSKKSRKNVAKGPVPISKPSNKPMTVASAKSSDDRKNIWSIELGGFGKEQEVINAVTNAMDVATEQLAYSHINFVNREDNGEKSHWARFVSLTEQQAKSACAALSDSVRCKVIDQ